MSGRRPVHAAATIALAVALASCGGSDAGELASRSAASTTTTSASAPTATAADETYLVRPVDEWVVRKAVAPAAPTAMEPTMTWFAEYDGPPSSSPPRVRLSGHATTLDGLEAELRGFSFERRNVDGRNGLVATSPDPIGPWVVAVELTDDAVAMALSYELRHEALADWLAATEPATEAEWRAQPQANAD